MARSIRDPQHPDARLELARPSVVLALGLLIANDHLFKQQFPGWVTGKLSDAAGLFVLGALLAWLLPRRIPGALVTAGIAFAFWKSEFSTPLINAWNHLDLMPVTRVVDFTDLLMLPCLALGARRWLPGTRVPTQGTFSPSIWIVPTSNPAIS